MFCYNLSVMQLQSKSENNETFLIIDYSGTNFHNSDSNSECFPLVLIMKESIFL